MKHVSSTNRACEWDAGAQVIRPLGRARNMENAVRLRALGGAASARGALSPRAVDHAESRAAGTRARGGGSPL
jgi:hypothetical protein